MEEFCANWIGRRVIEYRLDALERNLARINALHEERAYGLPWKFSRPLKLVMLTGALCVDLASGHLNSSAKALGSRRRNENGKVERLGSRLRRRNDSSVNTICRACRHSMCS
jgi:hypothetical protein